MKNEIIKKRIETKAAVIGNEFRDAIASRRTHEGVPEAVGTLTQEAARMMASWLLEHLWISVDEALPEYQQDVVVSDGLEYWMSWRTQETDAAHKDKNDFINHSALEIKYWMSIPQLKGGEE